MLVATLAMTDDTILPFSFPAASRKKITAAFDGGRLTSNGGVMLLAMADRRIGLAEKLSLVFPERRDATRIVHGGRILGSRASRCRPHRGERTRVRHALRRHQPRDRLGTVDL